MRLLLALLVAVVGVLPATATSQTLALRCDGRGGIAAMENSYIAATGRGDCWFHIGHHTYDLGQPWQVEWIKGSAFTVETLFSPPTELGPGRNHSVLTFEGSLDGTTWRLLASVPYSILASRQSVAFDLAATGGPARFVRIRQPRSAAQGLSGYLDSSAIDLQVSASEQVVPDRLDTLSCETAIMERFFAEHPCWFGGVNRYDSPSVFHTYPVDAGALTGVSGEAIVAPWRSDDFTYDGGDPTGAEVVVQLSDDAVTWREAGRFRADYGLPASFWLTASGTASFVRLVGEYHHGYARHPALKHVRAMMVSSRITLHR